MYVYGKSVTQQNLRQDNTMDKAGTAPSPWKKNLSVFFFQGEVTVTQASTPPESPDEAVDNLSVNHGDSDSEEGIDTVLLSLTRLSRIRTLTVRMTVFL